MMPGLVTEHRRWIKAQRGKHAALPAAGGMEIDGECACGNCGCLGNNVCGHECLDKDNNCTLLGDDTCPCCMIESAPLTDAQEDALTGQGALFANNRPHAEALTPLPSTEDRNEFLTFADGSELEINAQMRRDSETYAHACASAVSRRMANTTGKASLDPLVRPDWTSTGQGCSNSVKYMETVSIVESLIRNDAHVLQSGRADQTARLIVSTLAHKLGFGPNNGSTGQEPA